ncbi:pre-peptidase C-terminal domain-containing protein [Nostoc sp. CENA67]|uniref:Pre-peptidase C-terminal domain-containing protein n=1 Tax=Amazonocrinis nigriterrae CENA67 TaxID=2794033 RepID=A0A8J7LA53_9NOST|nr:ELWxxDGT repeat protein [Amazonocrinis nigriterrae]MBH8563701.1 pre-peptidase C-terminal domain-containing protein [Amazonocrinis nigriterrae CENA67]
MPSPYSGFPDPGSSRSTALDTTSASYINGSLSSIPNIFQDSVSSTDTSDYYKFRIGASSSNPEVVRLRLDGLSDNASLRLFNEAGTTLQTADVSGAAPELITRSLNPGIYYVRVGFVNAASTNYNLSLSANPITTNKAGDDQLAQAFSIGTLTNSYSTNDYVGNRGVILDDNDYYSFNIGSNGTFSLSLDGLDGNANVELLNSSGIKIADSLQLDTTPDSISTSLASGTYYVRVFPGATSSTNYNLQVSFNPDPVDNAGNTLAEARNINTLTSITTEFTDYVNSVDNKDYYRFDLTSSALIDLKLTPQPGNANVQLVNSSGGSIASSSQTGTAVDTIRRSLNAGTYYIQVYSVSGAATNYQLSVSAEAIGPDIAPNTLATAKNIGTLNNSQNFKDFVGSIDANDYYSFNLTNKSTFNLTLSGLSDNADVDLLNSSGISLQSSTQTGNATENINTTLAAGTYYVRIRSVNTAETFYNLSLSAEIQSQMLEINPGSGSSKPNNLTALGNTLYFTANDGVNGIQLWKSNGSVAGTTKVTNINPGNFNPENLTVFGNNLLFSADDDVNGRELWIYNGTTAKLVSDINSRSANSDPSNITILGSKAFFSANNGINGNELWVYDGTTVSLVKDIYSGSTNSNPNNLIAFNGKLYFTANDGNNGVELWSSNGTAAGTTLVKDIKIGASSSTPSKLTVFNNSLYFTADDGINGIELWKSDGTAGGTNLVQDITPGTGGFGPSQLTVVGNTLYFVTDSNNDKKQELWKIDSNGVGRVKNDLNAAPNIGFGPINLTAVGNTLYFTTYDSATGLELWKSDGTDAGTVLVKDIWPGADPNNSIPDSLVNFNGTLYFAASEPTNGREVWSSDGTALGTRRVSNINPGSKDANPGELTVVGTRLFFITNNETNGTELWVL